MVMTVAAAAEPVATPVDMPTGDVWMTPNAPSPLPRGAVGQAGSVNAQLPIGDVWPAEGGMTRAAQDPAPPQEQAAGREEIATGSVK
jgi:hypothetical protein